MNFRLLLLCWCFAGFLSSCAHRTGESKPQFGVLKYQSSLIQDLFKRNVAEYCIEFDNVFTQRHRQIVSILVRNSLQRVLDEFSDIADWRERPALQARETNCGSRLRRFVGQSNVAKINIIEKRGSELFARSHAVPFDWAIKWYIDTDESRWAVDSQTLMHEYLHLFGLADVYQEQKLSSASKVLPAQPPDALMGTTVGPGITADERAGLHTAITFALTGKLLCHEGYVERKYERRILMQLQRQSIFCVKDAAAQADFVDGYEFADLSADSHSENPSDGVRVLEKSLRENFETSSGLLCTWPSGAPALELKWPEGEVHQALSSGTLSGFYTGVLPPSIPVQARLIEEEAVMVFTASTELERIEIRWSPIVPSRGSGAFPWHAPARQELWSETIIPKSADPRQAVNAGNSSVFKVAVYCVFRSQEVGI